MNKKQHLTDDEKTWLSEREERCANSITKSPYYNKINDNFIGWPTAMKLGGYNFSSKVILNEHRISELDPHPNEKGQAEIAKYLHELL